MNNTLNWSIEQLPSPSQHVPAAPVEAIEGDRIDAKRVALAAEEGRLGMEQRLSERVADQSRAKLRLSQRRTPSKLLQLFIPVPQRTHPLRAVSCKNPKLRRCRSWIDHQNSAVLTQHNKSPRTSTSLYRRLSRRQMARWPGSHKIPKHLTNPWYTKFNRRIRSRSTCLFRVTALHANSSKLRSR